MGRYNRRVSTSHRSQAVDGVALEYQIALANQVGANPWFCVHHLASDDYVRRMAIGGPPSPSPQHSLCRSSQLVA